MTTSPPSADQSEHEAGVQPLDTLMLQRKLSNHDLVKVSTDQLTHKMVNKGRRGRRLTRNVQMKILNAWNTLSPDTPQTLEALFTYRGR